jgi:polysaccharide biosynthesis protein PslH
MKILFLSPYVPYPILNGGRRRTEGLIRCLARWAKVQVFAIGDPHGPDSVISQQRLADLGVSLDVFAATGPGPEEADAGDVGRNPDALAHFRSPDLIAALSRRRSGSQPDVVHFEELVMAQYAPLVGAPRVLDRQKIEWSYHEALAMEGGTTAAAHLREAARFRRFEAASTAPFALTLVTGESDRQLLGPSTDGRPVHVIPIGVDDAIVRPPERIAAVNEVLLYGTLDYPPNAAANDFYFRTIWPRLARTHPELRTLVVGSGRAPDDLPRTDPRVDVRGYVPEIAPILQGPRVLLVPLRVGGGVRTKILEALAAGMPVVSTAVGVENLGLVPGRHYLNAESAEEMAAAVSALVRDPERAASLGREGAAHVDASFRWEVVARRLEPLYAGLTSTRPRGASASARRRVLLVGVRPLPDEPDARGLSFPGHRTAQFLHAVSGDGAEIERVLLDEDPECAPRGAATATGTHVLPPEAFRAGQELQRVHDAFRPDVVLAAGGYHAARVVTLLTSDQPRFIDLAGDLSAEGQVRAAEAGDSVLADYLAVLSRALRSGDAFSVVGPSQRLALLGQLGLAGRLTGARLGEEPIAVVPLAAAGPEAAPPLPAEGLRVLWSGGYNTWMDGDTLLAGLEQAMARRSDVVFVSTGGAIAGHHEEGHRRFWARVRASPFAARFVDHGRLPRGEATRALVDSHVVLSISRRSLEAELGSRQRVVEAMAYGRPVITTGLGDLAATVEETGAGAVVPAGDPAALAGALVRFAEDRGALAAAASHARAAWQSRFTDSATTTGLAAWVRAPRRWPESVLDGAGTALQAERLRLQSELDAIRSSRTFRALRTFDRWLGRGPSRR